MRGCFENRVNVCAIYNCRGILMVKNLENIHSKRLTSMCLGTIVMHASNDAQNTNAYGRNHQIFYCLYEINVGESSETKHKYLNWFRRDNTRKIFRKTTMKIQ